MMLVWTTLAAASIPSFPPHLVGNVTAAYALLERVLSSSAAHFDLAVDLVRDAAGRNVFTISDTDGGKTRIIGTTASELVAGVGVYLREHCGMTVGWVRGGGSHVFLPKAWPKVATPVSRARSVPFSHVTQVCTHSYTLVWHNWDEWERFIDWMALAGHNSIVAPTGQEEVQYRVLTEHFGVSDIDVRNWTNGPAWLTWSRGQNSHGNGIGGPLPRSFMKAQWTLQRKILARYRELGIVGHLPAFGGYAPWALAVAQNATHRIARGVNAASDTAWIDGRDELYTAVADQWMSQILRDFGSDHVWQMDAFFANGSSWGAANSGASAHGQTRPPCVWSAALVNTYLAGYVHGKAESFATLAAAKAACLDPANIDSCGGVTSRNDGKGPFEIRGGMTPVPVPATDGESSYVITNRDQCLQPPDTTIWRNRSAAAYGAVQRADGHDARWIYQGYALGIANGGLGPASDPHALDRLHSFTSPIPEGQFILLDMSAHGDGEFKQWKGQWRLPFIWTALHDYGGDMGIKGNLSKVNNIPFGAPPLAPSPAGYDSRTQAVGVGYSAARGIEPPASPAPLLKPWQPAMRASVSSCAAPEGLDQNPAYYELLQEAAFKSAAEPNIIDWLIARAHRRYGLFGQGRNAHVSAAWAALGASGYAIDKGVNDGSGVCQMDVLANLHLDRSTFDTDRSTPQPALCLEWTAWGSLLAAAPAVSSAGAGRAGVRGVRQLPEPFRYDLVNTAREVLAQLSTPLLLNFSAAIDGHPMAPAARVNTTGKLFVQLLDDLERLLATDTAFMLGPWLASARKLGGDAADCTHTQIAGDIGDCANFMEWNARAQLTTWYPVLGSASAPQVQQGGRDHDYARKQWSGLLSDVYIPRAKLNLIQALQDVEAGRRFNAAAVSVAYAAMAFTWQTTFGNGYPIEPVGDAVAVSTALRNEYAPFFVGCS